MKTKKYIFIPAKDKRIRGIKLAEAEGDETGREAKMNPVEADDNMKIVYKYMLREAKTKITPQRAEILVMTLLNLFNGLLDKKFSSSLEGLLNRVLKIINAQLMK